MSSESLAPIIINKKIEEAGEGHHGGAWKVAYADFVTAMMAFFLLMWLLNATTEKQRKGLADYFSPSIPVHKVSGGGDGQFWGDNVFADEVLAQSGTGAAMEKPTSENQAKGSTGVELAKQETPSQAQKNMAESEHLLEQLQLRGGESMAQLMDLRHVVSRITDEGVVFDVFALPGEPLFWPGTNEPTEVMLEVARLLSEIINLAANDIAVNAHLASLPVMVREYPVWDISRARANIGRELLVKNRVSDRRFQRISGFADRKPMTDNPLEVNNNRFEFILLRSDV